MIARSGLFLIFIGESLGLRWGPPHDLQCYEQVNTRHCQNVILVTQGVRRETTSGAVTRRS